MDVAGTRDYRLGLLSPVYGVLQSSTNHILVGQKSLCDQGWIFHEGSCYWGSEAEVTVEYVQAAAICHQSASHLASILTSSENDFVRTAFPNLSKIWLGAHNGGEQPGTYRKSLLWSDGSFPAFRASVLLNAVPNADSLQCLAMHEEGEWLVKPPTKKKSVVCKKYPHFSQQFGTGEGAVHLTHMDCQGCEDHLNQCRHGSWHDVTSCSQAKAVGLKCSVVCPTYETNAVTDARFPFKPLNPSSLRVDFTVQTAGTIRLILSRDESLAGAVYSIGTNGYITSFTGWSRAKGSVDNLDKRYLSSRQRLLARRAGHRGRPQRRRGTGNLGHQG
ncbi:uncharacterized protein LOC110984046 isoform X2 [Acanthaster planci]|uniref:Uncharacterized protein LOC110984046 isoform X2 n=1 Tax=Acanthaster planci TaxID=133434 RepID=A0A8B7Z1Q2_ACAPL|nr:uncharacterized protein LOC110984046 isoform X2 [Acanthaster planci]